MIKASRRPWPKRALYQAKSSRRMAKAATISGSNVLMSEQSVKMDKFAHAVKSLNAECWLQPVKGQQLRIPIAWWLLPVKSSSHSSESNPFTAHSGYHEHWQYGNLWSAFDRLGGMQPREVSVVDNVCQLDPNGGSHQSMHGVRTLCLPHTIDSTYSHYYVFKSKLDSHTVTCVVDQHAPVIHYNPK